MSGWAILALVVIGPFALLYGIAGIAALIGYCIQHPFIGVPALILIGAGVWKAINYAIDRIEDNEKRSL
jgi:hypothetical protein